jgi:translation initiation factor 1 (eIF-1/SUI1)
MAKKHKPDDASASTQSPLKHNPFASLLGAKSEGPVGAESAERTAAKPEPKLEGKAEPTRKVEPESKVAPRPEKHAQAKTRGRVVLRRETKHRGGKAVIVVRGLALVPGFDGPHIEALAKQLKQQLGCGGTVEGEGKERQNELQGDRAAQVAELLRAEGFRVAGVTS